MKCYEFIGGSCCGEKIFTDGRPLYKISNRKQMSYLLSNKPLRDTPVYREIYKFKEGKYHFQEYETNAN